MVKCSSCKYHWDLIGPLWFILPSLCSIIPHMSSGWKPYYAIWKFSPNLRHNPVNQFISNQKVN
jgi:hypothetical protein